MYWMRDCKNLSRRMTKREFVGMVLLALVLMWSFPADAEWRFQVGTMISEYEVVKQPDRIPLIKPNGTIPLSTATERNTSGFIRIQYDATDHIKMFASQGEIRQAGIMWEF